MAVLDHLKYEMQEDVRAAANIKIIGVGGGGSNAVAHMMAGGLEGVEFYVINTDVQALQASPVPNKLAIGGKITHGRGAGADPAIGRQAALEDTARICEILQGADMVFIAAGLGCGTGTGAAPVVASIAKELNALTVAVVTKPFTFEGKRRMQQAEKGLEELAAFVDTVIAIPNDRLLALAPRGTGVFDALRMGHDFLRQTVADQVEIMTLPGVVNRDFSDLRSTMFGMGCALLGTATAQGENAAVEAARQAIGCPLHEDSGIRGARNVLLNLTGSSRLGLHEVNQACQLIRDATECDDVELNFGITLNEAMEDTVKVTVIATGFSGPRAAPVLEQEPSVSRTAWLSESQDEPAAAAEPLAHGEPPAAPVAKPGNGAPPLPPPEDLDDIDKPAYLRPRRMLH